MTRVTFDLLPDDARLWAFGANRGLTAEERTRLLSGVDEFLEQWAAHGSPLTCGRDWREDRFLAVAVDQRAAHASGCSIDGLYRVLRLVEQELGVSLLGGGNVHYRDDQGAVVSVSRAAFADAAEHGAVTRDTPVFDITVASAAAWRSGFEKPARDSWHDQLVPAAQRL
jgi:hypothetical protein